MRWLDQRKLLENKEKARPRFDSPRLHQFNDTGLRAYAVARDTTCGAERTGRQGRGGKQGGKFALWLGRLPR